MRLLFPRALRQMLAALFTSLLAAAMARASGTPAAYPDTIPADLTFETVVRSQPYPAMKYPVPIIGWKDHPEEVHATPNGALVFPRPDATGGLYLAPLLGDADGSVPALLSAERADRRLVDGYKPGIVSAWRAHGLIVKQTAFATLLSGEEVRTGREPLIGFARWTLSNPTKAARRVSLWLNFGAARSGHNIKFAPPVYNHLLGYWDRFVVEPDGKIAACVLTPRVTATFRPLPVNARPSASRFTVLNGEEAEVRGPEFPIDIDRTGDALTVNGWPAPHGADMAFEASRIHGLPVAMDVVVESGGKTDRIGRLFRTGLFDDLRPESEYIAPGQHSAPIPWSVLKGHIPQGKSRIVLRSYYPTPGGPVAPGSWEPIVYFTAPGVAPPFKTAGSGDPRENSLRLDVALAPGASRTFDLAIPYFPLPPAQGAALRGLRVDRRFAAFRAYWARELNRNAQFDVPEKRIRDSYRACLANNLLLVDKDPATGRLLPHPDPTAYEAVWAGDSGVIIDAMDRLGYHADAARYIDDFIAKQGTRKPDADVTDWRGFYTGDAGPKWISENGFILWAMAQHYRLTGDAAWLRRVAPSMTASADWIIRQRARTKVLENGEKPRHYGLLPRGAPSDIGEWDYWYWSDTYAYMGLRGAADVLREIGRPEAARYDVEAKDYKACILDSLKRSINRRVTPPWVPPSPYKNQEPSADLVYATWYSICSPIYMVEAGIFPAADPKATWTNAWLEKYGLYTGLPSFGATAIDPHYVYNQALSQLLRGETGKFLWTFYSLFAYGQSRSTYATLEGHNLLTGFNSEAWDGNRQPHMHSNSRVLDMVRIALMLEDGGELHLLAGTPTGWLAPGKSIAVRRAPTEFGDMGLTARSVTGRREVRVHIDPPARRRADLVLHVRPPQAYGDLRSVTVNGKPWTDFSAREVRLGKRTDEVDVVCWF